MPPILVAVLKNPDIARKKTDIARRNLVIRWLKTSKISRLPSAVFVPMFGSPLIAKLSWRVLLALGRPLHTLAGIVQHQLENRVAFLCEQCPVVAFRQMIVEYFLHR